MTDRTQHGAWRIPLLYALFASAWILFSDRLLDALNADPLIVGELQTAKGWAFVAITAGLLYVLLRRDSRRVQRSKAALHETEQRYRRIVETTEEGIWMIDANDQTTFVNQKMADLLGYSAAEMIGAPLLAFMDAEGQAISEAALVRRRQGIREQLEAKFCRRDCTTLWALVATNPVEDDEGRYAGALAMVTDITERKRAEAALRASEQQLSLIFDTVGDVIFLLSVEPEDCFRFITMNSTGLALTGLAPEQVIGKRVEEVLPATAHALVIGNYKEAIRENKTVRWEEVSEYPTGTLCGEVAVTPASDTAGNGTHLIGSVHDITDIRRAEQALHRYAERLNVLHEIDLAILAARSAEEIAEAALGRVQQLIPCQRASLTIFDYEAEEAVVLVAQIDGETMVEPGTRFPLREVEIPDQLRRGATHVIDDLSTLSTLSPMLQALCADGMRSHMAVPLLPLGELIGTLNLAAQDPGSFQPEDIDIACEIAAQLAVAIRGAQLYEAEQHARRFADTLHAANESLTRTLDLNSVLEALLDHLGQLVPYDSANVMLLTADACLAVHTTRGYERWTDPAKIRTISFDLSATPNLQTVLVTRKSLLIPDTTEYPGWRHVAEAEHVRNWLGVPLLANDQVIGIYSLDQTQIGFFTEEHVWLAEALAAQAAIAIQNARLHAQVQRHAAELELRVAQRTAQLETANKELEAFSYSVSHDLRAPLRAVGGFAEIIARRHRANLNEEGRHYIDNIVEASARMSQLIDDLLAYSRLGRQSVRRQPVPLHDLLAQIAKDLATRVAESGADLAIPNDLPIVLGDPTLLNQIFANLLGNALTYRRPDVPPRVAISCQTEPGHVVVCVSDNGIGISAEYYAKIFNVFQRLHSEDEYPGTGIGLAIVRKSAELLGGRVWVESVVGEGSTFQVQLPKE